MFLRGQPEGVRIIRKSVYNSTLYELLKAYSEFRASKGSSEALTMRMARRRIVSVEEALARLRNMIGQIPDRSEEHTSELQSLMRISYAVFCLKQKTDKTN